MQMKSIQRSSLVRPAAFAALATVLLLAAALGPAATASAQPLFIGVETNNNGDTSSSLSVPVPPGVAGDLLVAVVVVYINPNLSTPTGFTPIPNFTGFNDANCASGDGAGIRCQISAFYKFADGSETSVAWVFDPAGNIRPAIGAVLRYRDTHPTDPIGATASANGTGSTATAPSVNTTENDSLVLRVAGADSSSSKAELFNDPPTVRWNRGAADNLASIVEGVTGAGSDAIQAVAGATGTATWSVPDMTNEGASIQEQWVAGTIVIRPDPGIVDTDLAVTKTADAAKVNPGDALGYTITVSNNGPGDVTGASVSDTFPADLTCTWTCSAAAGSACGAANGAGDVSETVDVAVGADVTFAVSCIVAGDASGDIINSASVSVPGGFNDTDPANDSDSATTAVNQPPVAVCQDVELVADAACMADVAGSAAFDGGSSDPDGDLPLTFDHSPAGPYGLGDTAVTLTVTDALGLSDTCSATVTVVDEAAPVIQCNAPATITPPDAPISFTATATDNCSVASVEIISFECFKHTKKGKKIDKGQSCVVSADGATLTIDDSGGVGTTIAWQVTAVDGSGNPITQNCSVDVENPGQGNGAP